LWGKKKGSGTQLVVWAGKIGWKALGGKQGCKLEGAGKITKLFEITTGNRDSLSKGEVDNWTPAAKINTVSDDKSYQQQSYNKGGRNSCLATGALYS